MDKTPFENVYYWEGKANIPQEGSFIKLKEDKTLDVPPNPIIPFIEGDGIGPEITQAMLLIINEAVKKAYGDERKIYWVELLAGDKAEEKTGERLPQ
ncbi:MAG: NADP-dependent isocitrate dehydrogenase, partial [Aquificae bacterium]|nr:NADP-dependent isocitrate dehydrogenase [Aquificota bacterium]